MKVRAMTGPARGLAGDLWLLETGAGAGVAHGAHIGGFLAGLGLALVVGRK
jgi:membrane associated rhomboid family serine protease